MLELQSMEVERQAAGILQTMPVHYQVLPQVAKQVLGHNLHRNVLQRYFGRIFY